MDRTLRKFPHSDTDVSFCKSQNARLLQQNKTLMSQLEVMSRKLSASRSITSSEGGVKESTTEDDDDDEDFAQRLSIPDSSGLTRKRALPTRSRLESSISSNVSELHHDDLEKELEEEKKMRRMAESQRDEALQSVADLRQNLAKNRAKLKEKNSELSISHSQEVVSLRLENENLLESLKESSAELSKLTAENQTLIEEQALGEAGKEKAEREKLEVEKTTQKLTMELTERKCQIDELTSKLEEDGGSASRLEAENHSLRQELEHLREMAKSVVSLDSLKSCGLFHTSSEFRLELTSTEIALWGNNDGVNDDRVIANEETGSFPTSKWESLTSELDIMKRQSRDGEKRLMKMLAAIEALEKERNQLRSRLGQSENHRDDAEAKADDATTQLQKREAQLQELLKEVEEKGDELNDVCVDNEKKRKTIEDLRRELTAKNKENESMRLEMEELSSVVSEKTSVLAKIEEKASRSRDQVRSLEGINDVLDAEKSRLADESREKSDAIADLERKLVAQTEEGESQKQHYENLIRELKRTKRESAEHLEAERKKAESINEERKEMLVEIEGLKKTWEEKIAKQRIDTQKLSKLVKKYKEQESSSKEELARKDETNEALRRTLEEERKSLKDYEDCYSRLEKQMAESQRVASAFKAETIEKERIAQLKTREMEGSLRDKEEELRQLRVKLTDMEGNLEDDRRKLGEMKSRVESKNDAFVQKDAERRHLERLLKDAKEVLTNQSGTISELEKKIVELDEEVRKKNMDLREKEKTIEAKLLEAENQKNQFVQCEEKTKELTKTLEEKERDILAKGDEIRRITAKCEETQSTAESLEKVIADQKREMWQRAAQMKQVDMALQEHRSDNDVAARKLETALERTLMDLKAKTEEVEKLGEELKSKDRLYRETKDATARAEANSFVYKERVDELEKKFQEDRKRIDDLKGEKTALDLKLNLCQDQLTAKQNQLVASNKELQQFQDQVAQLEKRVDDSLLGQRETINLKNENEDLRRQLNEKARESTTELQKLSMLVESNVDQHRREMAAVREAQEASLLQRDDVILSLNSDKEASAKEKHELTRQLAEAREMVTEMKRELRQRTLIVDEANEALTLKDCQIAKLEGRLASLDRLEKMVSTPQRRVVHNYDTVDMAKDTAADINANNQYSAANPHFMEMASSVGVAPLRRSTSPQSPSASTRVRFDSVVDEKQITPSPDKSSLSPRTSSPRPSYSRPYLTLSPPRFSPPSYVRGLSESPPIPQSLHPTPSGSYPSSSSAFASSAFSSSITATTASLSPRTVSSPPQSAASELDVRFKGVIQYLKDNGKCDDELEEISREMKDTLKRSLIDKKLTSSTQDGVGVCPVGAITENGGWRQSLNSTMGSVAMETEMENAERQLRDLEARLRANATQRANIDSQLNGLNRKKLP